MRPLAAFCERIRYSIPCDDSPNSGQVEPNLAVARKVEDRRPVMAA